MSTVFATLTISRKIHHQSDPEQDKFDADVALSTGELRQMIPALIDAMGGELTTSV